MVVFGGGQEHIVMGVVVHWQQELLLLLLRLLLLLLHVENLLLLLHVTAAAVYLILHLEVDVYGDVGRLAVNLTGGAVVIAEVIGRHIGGGVRAHRLWCGHHILWWWLHRNHIVPVVTIWTRNSNHGCCEHFI